MADIYKQHRGCITFSQRYRDAIFKEDANRWRDYCDGKFDKINDDPIQIFFNYFVINIDRMLPSLSPEYVKFKVDSIGGDQINAPNGAIFNNLQASIIEQEELNGIWIDKNIRYQVKQSVLDGLCLNLGVVRTVWDRELEDIYKVDPAMAALMDQKNQDNNQIPGEQIVPTQDLTQPKLLKDELSVRRIDPLMVGLDPAMKSFMGEDMRYFFEEKDIPADIVENSKLKSLLKGKQPTGMLPIKTDSVIKFESKDVPSIQTYKLYEFYDLNLKKMFLYYDKEDKPIYSTDIKRFPYRLLRFRMSGKENVYPPSDFKFYEVHMQEKALYRTAIANSLNRRIARKILVDSTYIGEKELEKLKSQVDMEYVPIDCQGKSIREVVYEPNSNPIDYDVWKASSNIDAEVQQISSVNSLRLGESTNDQATIATLANQSSQNIEGSKLDMVKTFCKGIAEDILENMKMFADNPKDVKLPAPNNTSTWYSWDKHDIEFAKERITVNIEPPEPPDIKVQREQNIMNLLMSPPVTQSLAQSGKRVDNLYLIEEFLKTTKSNKEISKLIVDIPQMPDDPLIENELMMNGQQPQPAQGQDHMKHLMTHTRFMNSPVFATLHPDVHTNFQRHVESTKQFATMDKPNNAPPAANPGMMKGPMQVPNNQRMQMMGRGATPEPAIAQGGMRK